MLSTSMDRLALWRDLLTEQRASGLSIKEWCAKEGVSTFTYYYWRKRISSPPSATALEDARPSAVSLPASPEWLPVPLALRANVKSLAVAAERPTFGPTVQKASTAGPTSDAAPITLRVGLVYVEVGDGFDRLLLGDVLSVLEARC